MSVLREIQSLELKIAKTYENYKNKHPNSKKTRNDPMFQTPTVGYRTDHNKWYSLEGHKQSEEEKGNHFPDISKYPNHEAIWVTHSPKDARRYGDDVRTVDLSGAQKIHADQDGGYLYIRPKKQ
jgi:hypothetical protein